MDQGFYDTLVTLAKIGAAGVGIAIFLMVFIMIIRGQPVDPATARLRQSFLIWGFAFAVVVGLFTVVPPLLQKPGGPVEMRLSFSPDMKNAGLTPPETLLPDGKEIPAEEAFSLPPSALPQVLTVKVDRTIDEVKNLRQAKADLQQTTNTLAAAVASVTDQRDSLAKEIAPSPAAAPAAATLNQQSQKTDNLQAQVQNSIKAGDFAHAKVLSTQLHASILQTKPTVTAITQAHH